MLLWDHEPASSDGPGRLNVTRLAATCAADWGLYTTVTGNLATCAGQLGDLVGAGPDRKRIRGRIGTVTAAMAAAPKTVGWQLRAKVGRRVRWYQRTREVTR